MKKWMTSIIFFTFSILLTVILYMITEHNSIGVPLDTLSIELTRGYQVRQIITTVTVYLMGFILTAGICINLKFYWIYFLAYPVGIATWCTTSLIVVMLGIPYRLGTMLLIFIPILAVMVLKIYKYNEMRSLSNVLHSLLYVTGIASIVSSGIFTIFLSFDSAYFIIQYGQLLAEAGKINDSISVFLTWTGIMPALMSSLATFCGFETIFVLHYLLIISFIGIFGVAVYEALRNKMTKKKAQITASIVTGCLMIVPAFHLLAQFVIANTYFMIYMFLFIIIAYKMGEQQADNNSDYMLLLSLITIMLTMCRAEACTTVCFLIICISTLNISNRKLLLSMVFPAGIIQIVYYVKVFLLEGNAGSELVNPKNVAIILGVWIMTLIYVVMFRNRIMKKIGNKIPVLMLVTLFAGNIILILLELERAYINLDAEFYNVANEYWGYFPWIALLLCIIIIRYANNISYFDLVWIGYILFNFAICMGRFNDLRKGFGDSFNRMLIGVIPIFIFSVVVHMREYGHEKIEGKTKDEADYTNSML